MAFQDINHPEGLYPSYFETISYGDTIMAKDAT
jgi:hypothetical protein